MQEEIERKIDNNLTICVGEGNEREIDKNLTIFMEQGNEREIDKNLTICVNGVNGEIVLAEANFARVRENGGDLRLHHFSGFFVTKSYRIPNTLTYLVLGTIRTITS